MPPEVIRGSQPPRRTVCGTCGFFRMMHRGVSAPSCCAFPHRIAFQEVSGHWVLLPSGPGNRGRLACGTTNVARLEFPCENGLILKGPVNVGNPLKQSRGSDPPIANRRGEGAQINWCQEPRCSPRVRLIFRETFGVTSRVSSNVSHFKTERGTFLEKL